MCDLWKNTLEYTVPPGAIPAQIDFALAKLSEGTSASSSAAFSRRFGSPAHGTRPSPAQVKLYNSGSFFDPAAIPLKDYAAITERLHFANNIVVESHPRLINNKTLHFRDLLSGALEVAIGLETIHPEILPRLNKKFTLQQFADAADFLRKQQIALRAFILLNPPFLNGADSAAWAVKSAQFAFDCGASAVSIIPTRPGNGAIDALLKTGDFIPPRLRDLEDAHDLTLKLNRGRVFADTWDLQQFSQCAACFERRRDRLHQTNLAQQSQPRIECAVCGGK